MESKSFLKPKVIALGAIVILIALTFLTSYYGSVDIGDYADTAKYFTRFYSADIRNSHSYTLGLIHAPFLALFQSFIVFKISSLLFLALLTYSMYKISGDNPRAFMLMLASPAVWYMAPWINPIQLSALFFVWAFYFMQHYHETNTLRYLFYSGILLGLSWCVWNTILFFVIILALVYLYDRKLLHVVYFAFAVAIGLVPLFIIDFALFGFPLYTLLKTTMSNFTVTLFGGIYSGASTANKFVRIVLVALTTPFYFWKYYPRLVRERARYTISLTLCFLLLVVNVQLRYALIITPLMLLVTLDHLTTSQYRKQLVALAVVSCIFVIPYAIQITHGFENKPYGADISSLLEENLITHITSPLPQTRITHDVNAIAHDFPNSTFIVGPASDDYQLLAHYYWGSSVHEFVSLEDFTLSQKNQSVLFSKTFSPIPHIHERRQIFLTGGIAKNPNDLTNYSAITLAIGVDAPIELDNFTLVKNYTSLYVSRRVN